MRTFVSLVLTLILAAPAFAFRPRPVSDLRFVDRLEAGWYQGLQGSEDPGVIGAASDGSDYLILLRQSYGFYTQMLSHDGPYGPAVLISAGNGGGASVVWTGSEYLVAWTNAAGVHLTAISRLGAMLSAPKLVIAVNASYDVPKIVSNGRRVLVTLEPGSGLLAALFDLGGQPVGPPFPLLPGVRGLMAVTGTGDGFAVAVGSSNGTRVFRLDDAAAPLLPAGTLVDGPSNSSDVYQGYPGTLASDGTNVALVFGSGHSSSPVASKTAVIGPRGELLQGPRTIAPHNLLGPFVTGALWNGSEYAAVFWSSNDSHIDAMFQRFSRTGELIDKPAPINSSVSGPAVPTTFTTNGSDYLITTGRSYVRFPLGSTALIESADLTRSIDPQQALAIAGGRANYLAAWLESEGGVLRVRASRIDAQGRYLDGAGIVIASMAYAERAEQTISVDSDGENWLVVWSDRRGGAYGARISPGGALLDRETIAIPGGYGATVRWGGDSWMVVSTNGNRLMSTTVSRDGLTGALTFFDQVPDIATPITFGYPSIAFDGQQFVVAAPIIEDYCGWTTCVSSTSLVTERLDWRGNSVAGSRFLVTLDGGGRSLSIATNGSQDLIVFEQHYKIVGFLSNKGSAPATIPIAADGVHSAVMWDGSKFVVAATNQKGALQLVHVSTLGVAESAVTLPRDPDEFPSGLAFPPSISASLQASPGIGPPLAFLTQHDAYEAVPRAAFLFAGDAAESLVTQQVPPAPSIRSALGDPSGVTLTWAPQDHVLGFAIELRQPDGSERLLGVAAGSVSSTHIAYGGLLGTTLRLRAWNAAGLSSPSAEVQPATRRRAVGR